MDFSAFEKKYKNFYAPRFELTVAGEDVASQGMEIISVTVDNTLEPGTDHASFTVSNAFDVKKRDIRWFDQEIVVKKEVQMRMGYGDRLETMFIGTINSVRINFPAGGMPQLEVTALDLSHPMTTNKTPLSWYNKTDSDIARELASSYKLIPQVEDTRVPHVTVIKKDNQSDYDFLTERAEKNGFEFFIFERSLFFRRPAYQEEPIVNLEWGKTLMSFAPEVNVADQVKVVEVRGWDPKTKKEIVGRARTGDEEGRDQGRKSGGELVPGEAKEKTERVHRPVYTQEEADRWAKAMLTRIAEGLITGNGECLGLPELRAGRNVLLEGIGKKFSKPYYVKTTNHNMSASGYRTTFNIKETTI
jgi:phage protein D